MKWKSVSVGAACALAMGGGVAHGQKIINPDWASRPDGQQVAEAYPPLAMQMGIEGRSTLSCTVSTEGRLRNCVAMATTPPALGFDRGALKLSESFRMTPKMEDGRPRQGSVNIPIRFVLPADAGDDAGAAPHIGAPTSPRAAALAAQLAPILTRDIVARQDVAAEIALEQVTEDVEGQIKTEARRAINDGTRAAATDWGKTLADAYAATMTDAELQATLEFLSGPTGSTFEGRHMRVLMTRLPMQERFVRTASALARDNFCAQVACEFDRWQPPKGVALVNPPWSQRPTEHDIENMAPRLARLLGLSGWAQINCIAQPGGRLDSCVAVRESPERLHFGSAAEQLSDSYEIDLARVDRAIAGETVAILVNFKPTAPAPVPDDTPGNKVPSDEAMSLARRIVQADPYMPEIDSLAALRKALNSFPGFAGVEMIGVTAFFQAVDEKRPGLTEQTAKTYAAAYTPAELRAILDFRLGPGGQAAKRLDPNQLEAIDRFHGAKASADARRRFCAERDCEPAAAKAAGS